MAEQEKRGKQWYYEKWEDDIIIANYGEKTMKEIAALLGRSCGSVKTRIGILRDSGHDIARIAEARKWKQADDDYVKAKFKSYKQHDLEPIAEHLGRSVDAVSLRCRKLHLGGSNVSKPLPSKPISLSLETRYWLDNQADIEGASVGSIIETALNLYKQKLDEDEWAHLEQIYEAKKQGLDIYEEQKDDQTREE